MSDDQPSNTLGVEPVASPSEAVSMFRLSDGAADKLKEVVRAIPSLPQFSVPWWVWLMGAGGVAAVGAVFYGMWRLAKESVPLAREALPVLAPLALGLPPNTAAAMQRITDARQERSPTPITSPPTAFPSTRDAPPQPSLAFAPTTPTLEAVLALAPALGAQGSGTAAALANIAALAASRGASKTKVSP